MLNSTLCLPGVISFSCFFVFFYAVLVSFYHFIPSLFIYSFYFFIDAYVRKCPVTLVTHIPLLFIDICILGCIKKQLFFILLTRMYAAQTIETQSVK